MKKLYLIVTKEWFDMIASGEKKEEYREINKYWTSRLVNQVDSWYNKYDAVEFRNGYGRNVRKVIVECKGITDGAGKKEWGAEMGTEYYIIQLGNIIPQ